MEELKVKEKNKIKKGKRIARIIFIIILLVIVVSGVSYYYYTYLVSKEEKNIEEIANKNREALLEFNEVLEYGSELSYEELLNKLLNLDNIKEDTDIKILINGQEIIKDSVYKFETIGNYSVKVLLSNRYDYTIIIPKFKIIESTKESQIIVKDTKMPVISGITNKEITVGDEINLLEGISAQDEVDGELEVTIEGNVDNQKAGEYIIKVSAIDKNENMAKQEFKVVVKEKQTTTIAKSNSSTSNKKTSTSSSKTSTSNNKTSNSTSTATNSSSNSNIGTTTSSNDTSTKNARLQLATAEAKRVVSKMITSGMSDYEKAHAIYNYLHSNVARQTNQSNEAYKTNYGNEAYAALIMKKAACSGFCKAVTLMCNAAGLQSKHINANQWTHQWNTVLINGEWIILDAQGGIFGGTVHPLDY